MRIRDGSIRYDWHRAKKRRRRSTGEKLLFTEEIPCKGHPRVVHSQQVNHHGKNTVNRQTAMAQPAIYLKLHCWIIHHARTHCSNFGFTSTPPDHKFACGSAKWHWFYVANLQWCRQDDSRSTASILEVNDICLWASLGATSTHSFCCLSWHRSISSLLPPPSLLSMVNRATLKEQLQVSCISRLREGLGKAKSTAFLLFCREKETVTGGTKR